MDTGVCVGSDLVLIRVNRPQTNQHVYVNPADGMLKSTGTAALATIFQQEFSSGTKLKFTLKDVETGLYVGIDANDRLLSGVDAAGAMSFGAPDCTPPFVGLYAYGDDDDVRAVTAEANELLEATRAVCDPANDEVGSYLSWDAPALANASAFELVDMVGTQFKLREKNGLFVRVATLGANPDELVADASYLDAGIFDHAACGAKQSFRLVTDVDDTQRYVKTDTTHLRAINADCGPGTTSWEQFEFTPVHQP